MLCKIPLNKAPKNFFAEVEQVAFCTANIVPGVEISNDKLLQGRVISYPDTQRYRLGINFTELPINRPKVKVMNFNQDGFMEYYANEGTVNYEPNTLNQGYPKEAPESLSQPQCVKGCIVRKTIPLTDDFKQAGDRYRSLKKEEQEHLIDNIVNDLWTVDKEIQLKAIGNLTKACREFGERVARGLGVKN